MTIENFTRYKDAWLRYRQIGNFDANGNFMSPISFLEAEQLPKVMMDTFNELDHLYAIAQRTVKGGK